MFTSIHLSLIHQAIVQRSLVQLQYFSPASGQFTERCIEPIGTVYYGSDWHAIAYCRLRQDYRDFRLSRMSKLSLREETYPLHEVPALARYLKQQALTIGITRVSVLFHNFVPSPVRTQRYSYGFVLEKHISFTTEMIFWVADENSFCRWLLQYTEAVGSISPPPVSRVFQQKKEEL